MSDTIYWIAYVLMMPTVFYRMKKSELCRGQGENGGALLMSAFWPLFVAFDCVYTALKIIHAFMEWTAQGESNEDGN